MRRASRRTAAAAALLLALPLAGCGDDQDAYCKTLSEEERTLTSLADRSAGAQGDVLTPTLAAFERLRGDAPPELSDEWDTVVFAYRALADAVEKAGVDPGDYRPGKRPAGVSAAEAHELAAVASKLSSERVLQAASGIETHASDVCGVKFGV